MSLNETNGTTQAPVVEDLDWDDATWILTCTFIIFTMQSGFGLLEAGCVAAKTQVNIMYKNAVDVAFGGIAYWLVGYAFSFGMLEPYTNPFIGIGDFAVESYDQKIMGKLFATFVFQLSFATTSTTIVSGAMAERTKLSAYIVFSFLNVIKYAVVAHWTWAPNGWLNQMGMVDIAGSGAVHLVGGVSAVVASVMLGPRTGRYERPEPWKQPPPGNGVMVFLGTFILWWGWLGFNCGSTFGVSGGLWKLAAKAAATTLIASAAGGVVGVIASYILHRKYDIGDLCTAVLGALVGITAPCAVVHPWEAVIIGAVGGLVAMFSVYGFNKLRVDDPVGASSVHGVAGIWAMLAVGIFVDSDPGVDESLNKGQVGLIHGAWDRPVGDRFYSLGVQTLGCVAIIVWSIITSIIFLGLIKLTIGLRMPEQEEAMGADFVEHDISNRSGLLKVGANSSSNRHSIGTSLMAYSPATRNVLELEEARDTAMRHAHEYALKLASQTDEELAQENSIEMATDSVRFREGPDEIGTETTDRVRFREGPDEIGTDNDAYIEEKSDKL